MTINNVLENYFRKRRTPTKMEIHFLAESLQLEKKLVSVWFINRRQKGERKTLSTPIAKTGKLERKEIRCAEILMTKSKKIGSQNGIDLFEFPLVHTTGQNSFNNFKRFHFGKPNLQLQHRTAFFMTTNNISINKKFIKEIINYIVDVKEEDPFRFVLVEDERQSNCILVYDIHQTEGFRIPYSLTIVISPYSADWEDSGQLFRDQKIAEMFREFTEATDGINELDMICNINVKTSKMKQPFLSIFGKNVEENINNWELTECFLSDIGSWESVVQHFFVVLERMKPKSLLLTNSVLNERKELEGTLKKLESLIITGLAKMEMIKNTKEMSKYFQSQIEREIYQQINKMLPNFYPALTITSRIYSTPHINNSYWNNIINGQQLYDSDLVYKVYYEAEKKLKDMKSKGQYSIKLIQNELFLNGTAVLKHFQLIWRCIQQLNSIALHGNSFLTQRVFDILYDAEQHLKELGFNEQLENMKKTGN